MSSKTTRLVGGLVVIAVAIVLLAVLKKGESSSNTTNSSGKVPTIVIKHGKPVGGIKELTYNEGEQIHFIVDSDVSDEIHMHGYDIMEDVKAGGTVSFDFPASIEGVFEAELEDRKEQILELTVDP